MHKGRSTLEETEMGFAGTRRAFLQILTMGAITTAFTPASFGQDEKVSKKTFTYKTVRQCAIKADVYQPSGKTSCPVVVWIHGGALIMGTRGGMDHALLDK